MQKINQAGEYSIHIILFIARSHELGKRIVSALDISESQNISLNYTQQIITGLRQGGLIESERGPKGGFFLKKVPRDISLKDILILSEGGTMEIICETKPINHEKCSVESHCFLKNVWYGLKDLIDGYLGKITIQDLLDDLNNNSKDNLVNIQTKSVKTENIEIS